MQLRIFMQSSLLACMLGDSNVRSIGVLAAWCEAETHLLELGSCVDLYLAAGQHRRLCEYLASGGGVLTEGEASSSADQILLSAAETSQRSVDLLLREYYQMVQGQPYAGKCAGGSGSLLHQAFLMLCPTVPECCDLLHIVAGVAYAAQTAATAVVLLACMLVPVWLAVIRQLLRQQQLSEAAGVGLAGLLLLLLSDALHKVTALRRQKAAAVTPRNLQQLLAYGSASSELATLRQASKSVTTPNKALQQQLLSAPQAPSPAACLPGGSDGSGSFLSLLPAVSALQFALGVSSTELPTSRAALTAEVHRLGDVLGVRLPPDSLATPAAMAATLAELKTNLGI